MSESNTKNKPNIRKKSGKSGAHHMAAQELYNIAKNAIELSKMLKYVDDIEGWCAAKITSANSELQSVQEHIEYNMVMDAAAASSSSSSEDTNISIDGENEVNEGILSNIGDAIKSVFKRAFDANPEDLKREHRLKVGDELYLQWKEYLTSLGLKSSDIWRLSNELAFDNIELNDASKKAIINTLTLEKKISLGRH